MEWLKNMGLKKAFFILTFLFLLCSIILGGIAFWACFTIINMLTDSTSIIINVNNSAPIPNLRNSEKINWLLKLLGYLQIALPIIFVVLGLFLADIIFYKVKIKKPLAILQNGTERIQQQDLNFSMTKLANDELGDLCESFEIMRMELVNNKKELWRQMEERKILNIAFSHDLRNPITVVKGATKMLKKEIDEQHLSSNNTKENIELIMQYSIRIEEYIEAMTSIQKLEELKYTFQPDDWSIFSGNLERALAILNIDRTKELIFTFHGAEKKIWMDRSIIENTAENLISNALRYADKYVWIDWKCNHEELILTVSDDGPGFPSSILLDGPTPFLRNHQNDSVNFGMGLYVCKLFCKKHGGDLKLENELNGAKVIASFNIMER